MSAETSPAVYRVTPPVDLGAALDRLGVEHLTVGTERLLVIFRTAILDVRVIRGTHTAAARVAIEPLESPAQPTATATSCLDHLLEHLATTTETEWQELPADA